MKKIERYGEVFDETTDWLAFLRQATGPGPSPHGLAPDLDIRSGIGELYEALQGTPMQAAMASAALTVLEQGTEEERMMMHSTVRYEDAPHAKERLLKLLAEKHDELWPRHVACILHGLLEKNLGDPDVKAALQRELERPSYDPGHLEMAARHLPEWLIQNLPLLRPSPRVKDINFIAWLIRVPKNTQQALLDSIAALGKPYVDALIAAHLNPRVTEFVRQRDRPVLEAHPVFRQALAEALKKQPT